MAEMNHRIVLYCIRENVPKKMLRHRRQSHNNDGNKFALRIIMMKMTEYHTSTTELKVEGNSWLKSTQN